MKKGFTMVDNNVYDYLIGADLTCTELKIIMTIIRYTKGFHREECTLTASFISRITNKAQRTVEYALQKLCEKKLINKRRSLKKHLITYAMGIIGNVDENTATHCGTDTQCIAEKSPQPIADNKYNNINKNNYINKSRENYVPTPKATKFSNFENKHVIDYRRREMDALRRRIERNRQDSS